MRLVFEEQGWDDYTSWLKTDRKTLARINKLIEDVLRDPFAGIGKPEPLKYHLPGAWSRRIDDEHRLVYLVTESEIIVLAARYRSAGSVPPAFAAARTSWNARIRPSIFSSKAGGEGPQPGPGAASGAIPGPVCAAAGGQAGSMPKRAIRARSSSVAGG